MNQYIGRSLNTGIAIARIMFKKATVVVVKTASAKKQEIERFESARRAAIEDLNALYSRAADALGKEAAAIFETQALMMDDPDFIDGVHAKILEQQCCAEHAVLQTGHELAAMFSAMDGEIFQAKAADVNDIADTIIDALVGRKKFADMSEPVILAAQSVLPSDTMQMDKSLLAAVIMEKGAENSHVAIVARNLSLPALIDIPIRQEWDGLTAIVDGYKGMLILDPTEDVIQQYEQRLKKEEEQRNLLASYRDRPTATRSGQTIELAANIGNIAELEAVKACGAEGIGLFRSEFIYLAARELPSEGVQFEIYRAAAEAMRGKRVIIRTMDVGVDKKLDYLDLEEEENPALGYRGIRLCLDRPDIFRPQLRAIIRASAYGKVSVMFPMIISVNEVRKCRKMVMSIMEELRREKISFDENLEQGIMIETPAAVMLSAELAREADFFSIGTNDLTQYMLAIDRQNDSLRKINDPHHPAVLQAIQKVAQDAHDAGIRVGICGELGADTTLTEKFIAWKIDELSVAPGKLLAIRKAVCNLP